MLWESGEHDDDETLTEVYLQSIVSGLLLNIILALRKMTPLGQVSSNHISWEPLDLPSHVM